MNEKAEAPCSGPLHSQSTTRSQLVVDCFFIFSKPLTIMHLNTSLSLRDEYYLLNIPLQYGDRVAHLRPICAREFGLQREQTSEAPMLVFHTKQRKTVLSPMLLGRPVTHKSGMRIGKVWFLT